MTSDICQALERDDVFGDTTDPSKMTIRVPKYDEAMPAVLRQGAPVKEFEQDFFLVSLAHGSPNDDNLKFNILRRYDFPMRHRFGKNATQQDVARFVNGSKGLGTKCERFACFQFLLHISEILDIDTALNMA